MQRSIRWKFSRVLGDLQVVVRVRFDATSVARLRQIGSAGGAYKASSESLVASTRTVPPLFIS